MWSYYITDLTPSSSQGMKRGNQKAIHVPKSKFDRVFYVDAVQEDVPVQKAMGMAETTSRGVEHVRVAIGP